MNKYLMWGIYWKFFINFTLISSLLDKKHGHHGWSGIWFIIETTWPNGLLFDVGIFGRSFIKFPHLVVSYKKHCSHGLLLILIGWIINKSSSLKLLGQMEQYLTGSIYAKSFLKSNKNHGYFWSLSMCFLIDPISGEQYSLSLLSL